MNPVVRALTAGMRGVDCNTKLSALSAADLRKAEIDFAMRYVPLSGNLLGEDLDVVELEACLAEGLAIGCVQHTRKAGLFLPNAKDGEADGRAACDAAVDAGVPQGCTIFYDMEGPAVGTTADDCAAYDAAWCNVAIGDGFMPGGYFGYGLPKDLTPERLYGLKVVRYWKSGSIVVAPATCSWCMQQQFPFNQRLGGVAVDLDAVKGDLLGRFPVCVFPGDANVA
ncbi:MAG TPA: glycoside hydrolase domain-containing protein [Polyangiaceae bacterium]|nr:glycoside hydrolase domain-containing protein [Polyangiaceae bacterium]